MAEVLRSRIRQSKEKNRLEHQQQQLKDSENSIASNATTVTVVPGTSKDDGQDSHQAGEPAVNGTSPKALPKGVVLGKDGKP